MKMESNTNEKDFKGFDYSQMFLNTLNITDLEIKWDTSTAIKEWQTEENGEFNQLLGEITPPNLVGMDIMFKNATNILKKI
jgi:hypothetical protein